MFFFIQIPISKILANKILLKLFIWFLTDFDVSKKNKKFYFVLIYVFKAKTDQDLDNGVPLFIEDENFKNQYYFYGFSTQSHCIWIK